MEWAIPSFVTGTSFCWLVFSILTGSSIPDKTQRPINLAVIYVIIQHRKGITTGTTANLKTSMSMQRRHKYRTENIIFYLICLLAVDCMYIFLTALLYLSLPRYLFSTLTSLCTFSALPSSSRLLLSVKNSKHSTIFTNSKTINDNVVVRKSWTFGLYLLKKMTCRMITL